MLFALDSADQTLAVGGWVGGALGVLSTIVTAYLSYRSNRDRMQFDSQMHDLKARVHELEGDLAVSRQTEERIAKSEERCQKRIEELEKELAKLTQYLLMHGMPVPKPPAV
jgi:cob(I)alamin adenosyltransferase